MKSFKYRIVHKFPEGIWVCEECKRKNHQAILLKRWKLLAMKEVSSIRCDLCRQEAANFLGEKDEIRNKNLFSCLACLLGKPSDYGPVR